MIRSRKLFAALVVPAALLLSTITSPTTSGAATVERSASSSAFCKTLSTFAIAQPPVYVTVSAYHVWAKYYLPSYEKLASEAPSSSLKKLLNEVVAVMKYEGKATSVAKIKKYVTANSALWKKSVTQIFISNGECATNT